MQVGNGLSILQNSYFSTFKEQMENANSRDSTKHAFFEKEIKEAESKKDSMENMDSVESDSTKNTKSSIDNKAINGENLEPEEMQYVRELESIDRNVRAHEAAHIAAGAGVVTGGASFTYTRGPDGKMYATAGEVPIAMKEGRTPEETIQNARQIVAAAMAPSDPSPQDYKVAASAAQMESKARSEQAQEKTKEAEEALKQQESKAQETQAQKPQNTQEEQNVTDDSSAQDLFLRNYAIQSYKANFKNSSLMLEIAG
ncbi:putative metalloprotease CJM1_0395 family protein [Helicobacter winghamensis]|uniref:putative metalloprotease CJM1_0395 family protein n=1 Tax=Helicobacter winghamensis TaxID=157268 RepID=UPI00242F2673|nr:putative metalloprotease CJM1_0395 family protein [Helicobacter winghamensis]